VAGTLLSLSSSEPVPLSPVTGSGRCSRETPAVPGRRGRWPSASRRTAAGTTAAPAWTVTVGWRAAEQRRRHRHGVVRQCNIQLKGWFGPRNGVSDDDCCRERGGARVILHLGCSRSPNPHHLAVLACPGFVRAAPTDPSTSRDRLPSAAPPCCDRTTMKVSHLHSSCQRLTAHVDRGLASRFHEAPV